MAGRDSLSGFIPDLTDGNLGMIPSSGGQVGFLGISKGGCAATAPAFYKFKSIGDVYRDLIRGPAVDGLIAMFNNGVNPLNPSEGLQEVIYREIDDAGGAAAVPGTPLLTAGGTGTATCVSGGVPWRTRTYCIKIVSTGVLAAVLGDLSNATYQICHNYEVPDPAHRVWSEVRKFQTTTAGPPAKSKIYLEDGDITGNYVEFTDAVGAFVVGDLWTWTTTPVIPTVVLVLAATNLLAQYTNTDGSYIGGFGNTQGVGGMTYITFDRNIPAADQDDYINITSNEWTNNYHAVHIFLPHVGATLTTTYAIDTWITLLQNESMTFRTVTIPTGLYRSGGVSVVPGYALMIAQDSLGNGKRASTVQNIAPAVLGMVSYPHWHEQIGKKIQFILRGVTNDGAGGSGCLYPWNSPTDNMVYKPTEPRLEYRIDQLAGKADTNARMIVGRYMPGLGTVGIEWGWTMCTLTSDYFVLNYYSSMYSLHTYLRAWFSKFIGTPIDVDSVKMIQASVVAEVLKPLTGTDPSQPYSASSISMSIDPLTYLTTQIINYELTLTPKPGTYQIKGTSKFGAVS